MGSEKVNEKAKAKELKAKSDREFFLLHGYTGSPTDFNKLEEYLHQKFNANVKIIRLKGHGTKVEDLEDIELETFIEQAERELKKDLRKGRKIVVGGLSFGAQLALYLAAKNDVKGVFTVSIPNRLKFPFNIPFIGFLGKFKNKWRKRLPSTEIKLREGSFHYRDMHANALRIAKKLKKLNDKSMNKIKMPILNIHSKKEPLGHYKSIEVIERKVGSKIKESFIFEEPNHNLFFSEDREQVKKLIGDFIEKHDIFHAERKKKVSAIVPSYNEGERIADVLKVLVKVKSLDEIIVVDDGSEDNTGEIVKKFKNVRYLKNKVNMGKGYSMERGVKKSKGDVIFFCDADVIDLKESIVEDTLRPVVDGEVDMFIAIRGNFMQNAVTLFGINSGERALNREVWENVPSYYKHRYRIEAGLNHYAKKFGNGFGYKVFTHSQPVKERKYGFFRGTFLRWWMNMDVLNAYLSCLMMRRMIKAQRKAVSR